MKEITGPETVGKLGLGPEFSPQKRLKHTIVPVNDEGGAELEKRMEAAELEGVAMTPVELLTERTSLKVRDKRLLCAC